MPQNMQQLKHVASKHMPVHGQQSWPDGHPPQSTAGTHVREPIGPLVPHAPKHSQRPSPSQSEKPAWQRHSPPMQTSRSPHVVPSGTGPVTHPPLRLSQRAATQSRGSVSAHITGVPTHVPRSHTSPVVQRLESSHGPVRIVDVQSPVLGLHTLSRHGPMDGHARITVLPHSPVAVH